MITLNYNICRFFSGKKHDKKNKDEKANEKANELKKLLDQHKPKWVVPSSALFYPWPTLVHTELPDYTGEEWKKLAEEVPFFPKVPHTQQLLFNLGVDKATKALPRALMRDLKDTLNTPTHSDEAVEMNRKLMYFHERLDKLSPKAPRERNYNKLSSAALVRILNKVEKVLNKRRAERRKKYYASARNILSRRVDISFANSPKLFKSIVAFTRLQKGWVSNEAVELNINSLNGLPLAFRRKGPVFNSWFYSKYNRRFSPAISRRHKVWLKRLSRSSFFKSIRGSVFYDILTEINSKDRRRYFNTILFGDKYLFWSYRYIRVSKKEPVELGKVLDSRVVRYYVERRKKIINAYDTVVKLMYRRRIVPKNQSLFARTRASSQYVEGVRRGMDGLLPWSVNFRRLKKLKYFETVWDRTRFALRKTAYAKFYDNKRGSQLFSRVVNSITARAASLRIFGKVLNTHYSRFLWSSSPDLYLFSNSSNFIHPDLHFYNPTDTSFSLKRSNSISGFFPHFSNALIQEYTHTARFFLKSTAVLGWDKQIEFLDPGAIEQQKKMVSFDKFKNDAFYETRFNRYWNINFHKYNTYGFVRNNYVMFGAHLMTTNFLMNFESSVESNFNNFYSCNRVAAIKMINSLLEAADVSDTKPNLINSLRSALSAYNKSNYLLTKLKKRSGWHLRKRSHDDFYRVHSALSNSLASAQPYHASTIRRLRSLLSYNIGKFFKKGSLYDNLISFSFFLKAQRYDVVEDYFLPLPLLVYYKKIFSRLALIHAAKRTLKVKKFCNEGLEELISRLPRKFASFDYFWSFITKKDKVLMKQIASARADLKHFNDYSFLDERVKTPQNRAFVREVWRHFRTYLRRPLFYKFIGNMNSFYGRFLAGVRAVKDERVILEHKLGKRRYFLTNHIKSLTRKLSGYRPTAKRKKKLRSRPALKRTKFSRSAPARGRNKPFRSAPARGRNKPFRSVPAWRHNKFSRGRMAYKRKNFFKPEPDLKKLFPYSFLVTNKKARISSFDKKVISINTLRELNACVDQIEKMVRNSSRRVSFVASSLAISRINHRMLLSVRNQLYSSNKDICSEYTKDHISNNMFSNQFLYIIKKAFKYRSIWRRTSIENKLGIDSIGLFTEFIRNRSRRGRSTKWYFFKSNITSRILAPLIFHLRIANKNKYKYSLARADSFFNYYESRKLPADKHELDSLLGLPSRQIIRKVLNLSKTSFDSKKFLKNSHSKSIGFFFLRFSLADHYARAMGEMRRYRAINIDSRRRLRAAFRNIIRFNKKVILKKRDIEAKGRSIFVYYIQKKNWYQRKSSRPFTLMASKSTPLKYKYGARLHALVSVYGFRKFAAVRRRARAKHYRQKVFIRKILRRRFACNMRALHTRWRLAKETKRKWFKYFDQFEARLANILCLVGFYEKLDDASAAIRFGGVRVNNSFCINPDYRVKPLDVISLDMQVYLEIRSERLFNVINRHLAKPDYTPAVKRRILGQAAEFLKKYSAIARFRGEGYSVTKFLFFKKLLSATVTRLMDRKKFFKPRAPFKAKKNAPIRRRRSFRRVTNRPTFYSKADLGTGIAYEKIKIRNAPSPSDKFFTPTKIRRMLLRALKSDAAALSSSLPTSSDIFYKCNNVVIYLRRPHSINEMFEKSQVVTNSTYNAEVIQEFYTSRFWK